MSFDIRFVYLEKPKLLPLERSRFDSKRSATLELLKRELRQLGATQILLQAGFRQIKNDGWPYASSSPDHPACSLQFSTSRGEHLVFNGWQYRTFDDNLRAIACTLEALRAVDRHGVVKGGEQYAGFKQLAAPGASDSLEKSVTLLVFLAGEGHTKEKVLADPTAATAAYRAAAKKVHPDTAPEGASRSTWDAVQAAKLQLDAHFAPKEQK